MELTVKIKADSFYDTVGRLESVLFQSRVDISSERFYVKKLRGNIYEINLPDAPSNWEDILKQYGKICAVQRYPFNFR